MRLAIVHDYLNQLGGAERVIEAIHSHYPDAPIYTSLFAPERLPASWADWAVRTSFLQRLPIFRSWSKLALPFYPLAFGMLDLRPYDVVLSSSSAFGQGVRTRSDTCHVAYIHSPMRFAWQPREYFEHTKIPTVLRYALAPILGWLRVWDLDANRRVNRIIANSQNVARRIKRIYRRSADAVLSPPCDCERFRIDTPENYYLVVSRLRSYKRIDRAVTACNRLKAPLVIIGEGSDRARLESLAGPTIRFLGQVRTEEVAGWLARCRALVFPGEEDFGIVPLEAMASGRPVLALGRGGALETVVPAQPGVEPTGLFFDNTDELTELLCRFDESAFRPESLRAHAMTFDRREFCRRLNRLLIDFRDAHR